MITRPGPEREPMICPVCGIEATSKTESVVSDRLCEPRLSVPRDLLQMPGARWTRYEPCGHDA